jgi:hypothetical protein
VEDGNSVNHVPCILRALQLPSTTQLPQLPNLFPAKCAYYCSSSSSLNSSSFLLPCPSSTLPFSISHGPQVLRREGCQVRRFLQAGECHQRNLGRRFRGHLQTPLWRFRYWPGWLATGHLAQDSVASVHHSFETRSEHCSVPQSQVPWQLNCEAFTNLRKPVPLHLPRTAAVPSTSGCYRCRPTGVETQTSSFNAPSAFASGKGIVGFACMITGITAPFQSSD